MKRALPDFDVELSRPFRTENPRLILGPRSYLADRIVPDLEMSIIPSRHEPASTGRISARAAPSQTRSFVPRRQRLKPANHGKHVLPPDVFAIDLRVFGLGNWAHALNTGVPLALKVADELHARGLQKPRLILNSNLSQKVTTFFERLGFDILETDKVVEAPFVIFEEEGHVLHGLHGLAHDFLARHLDRIVEDILHCPEDFGDKIFLNRKDSRRLTNNDEIVTRLEAKGFRTIYAEDWSLDQQVHMILKAQEIVAVHGAALAPLLYRRRQDGALRFVEIFPAAHVVPFYLHMTYRLPCFYIGVRGAIDRAMLPGLYAQKAHDLDFTTRHSLSSFYVDPESLELAVSPDKLRDRFGRLSKTWSSAGLD